jgi:hypothetical protein
MDRWWRESSWWRLNLRLQEGMVQSHDPSASSAEMTLVIGLVIAGASIGVLKWMLGLWTVMRSVL